MRVFVSAADSYVGANIVKRLQAARATGGAARGSAASPAVQIVGSVTGTSATGLLQTTKVGDVGSAALALGCTVVVVNLVAAPGEAAMLLQALRDGTDALAAPGSTGGEQTRRLVVLSSLASWQATRRGKAEDGSLTDLTERAFRRRRAGTEFEALRVAEGQALALAAGAKGAHVRGLDVTVLGCGLPYGSGEGPLLAMLEEAWRCEADGSAREGARRGSVEWAGRSNARASVTVASAMLGRNFVPTVHVQDAAAVAAGVALGGQSAPAGEEEAAAATAAAMAGVGRASYLVVADRGKSSLRQIGAAVSRAVGPGRIRIAPVEEAAERESAWRAEDAAAPDGCRQAGWLGLLDSDLSFDQGSSASFEVLSGAASGGWGNAGGGQADGDDDEEEEEGEESGGGAAEAVGEALEWRCGDGLVAGAALVASEFVRLRGLRPVTAAVVGPVGAGCGAVARAVGARWRLPVVTAESAVEALTLLLEAEAPPEPEPAASAEEAAAAARRAAEDAARGARAAAAGSGDEALEEQGEEEEEAEEGAGAGAAGDGERPAWLEEADSSGVAARAAARKLLQRVELTRKAKGAVGRKLGARVVRWWLSQPLVRNRGWVLSGFPRGRAECEELVRERGEAGEEEEEDAAAVERLKGAEEAEDGDDDVYGVEAGEGEEAAAEAAEEDEEAVPVSRWLVPAAVVALDGQDEALVAAARAEEGLGEEAARAGLAAWRRLNEPGGSVRSAAGFLSRHGGVECLEAALGDRGAAAARSAASHGEEGAASPPEESKDGADPGTTPAELVALAEPLLAAAPVPQRGPGSAAYLEAAGVEAACPLWRGGAPSNFHPTSAEREAAAAREAAEAAAAAREAARAEAEAAECETALHTARQSQVQARRERIAAQEAELLAARARPLREWLGREVLPALSRGLLEAVKARPADPVDFLAEFLLAEAAAEGEGEAGTLA